MQRRIPAACVMFERSMEAQSDLTQLHHLCLYELGKCHLSQLDWRGAAACGERLARESAWSKCFYHYEQAVAHYMLEGASVRVEQLMEAVPQLVQRHKFAGKTPPVEKFLARKARKYFQQGRRLLLPAVEFMYVTHCFDMMDRPRMLATLALVDQAVEELERFLTPTLSPAAQEERDEYDKQRRRSSKRTGGGKRKSFKASEAPPPVQATSLGIPVHPISSAHAPPVLHGNSSLAPSLAGPAAATSAATAVTPKGEDPFATKTATILPNTKVAMTVQLPLLESIPAEPYDNFFDDLCMAYMWRGALHRCIYALKYMNQVTVFDTSKVVSEKDGKAAAGINSKNSAALSTSPTPAETGKASLTGHAHLHHRVYRQHRDAAEANLKASLHYGSSVQLDEYVLPYAQYELGRLYATRAVEAGPDVLEAQVKAYTSAQQSGAVTHAESSREPTRSKRRTRRPVPRVPEASGGKSASSSDYDTATGGATSESSTFSSPANSLYNAPVRRVSSLLDEMQVEQALEDRLRDDLERGKQAFDAAMTSYEHYSLENALHFRIHNIQARLAWELQELERRRGLRTEAGVEAVSSKVGESEDETEGATPP